MYKIAKCLIVKLLYLNSRCKRDNMVVKLQVSQSGRSLGPAVPKPYYVASGNQLYFIAVCAPLKPKT
ncbi:MAG: hypothetical protein ABS46_00630 [Cytophagaceae bacterium SCN 52-12]|nr:MAG: hypothetical protein ABS46_00630 [Cytophagaceae bacterium SCN 52-12]